MIQFRQTILIFLALAVFAVGCRSTKEYANLAQAGIIYATALDALLVATGNIAIDSTSEEMLQGDAMSNQTLQEYRKLSAKDEELLKTISQLRQHVKLLSKYFGLLHELATSDAPGRAKQAIGDANHGIIGNLNKFGDELRENGLITGEAASAPGQITSAVVSGIIRGALKDELNQRKYTIQKELLLQEKLLKVLSDKIKHGLTITQKTREQRLVIDPLTLPTPIQSPDTWINNRRSVLTMKLTADQLNHASESVKELREAFEGLMSGKLSIDRVNSLLADFSNLLSIAEKLRGL
jgi:hypothetical protein